MKKKILISTGGSGGHVIPATIFYEQLENEFDVFLVTDKRGCRFLNLEKYRFTVINTPKLTTNLFLLPLNLFSLFFSIIKSLIFLKKNKIEVLISTGGYMSLPLCLTAKILSIKIYLFEPNMVLGRANSIFLRYAKKIFCYSNEIINFPKRHLSKILLIDPLLRKEFYSITRNEKNEINDQINLLVIGGSQGAELFDNKLKKPIVVALNTQSLIESSLIDYRIACHPIRLLADFAEHSALPQPLITPYSMLSKELKSSLKEKKILDFGVRIESGCFEYN